MKNIFYMMLVSVLFSFIACSPTSNEEGCTNTCPEDQIQKEDCSCFAPPKLPATEAQQQEILQAILNKDEGKLNQLVNKVTPDSMIDLKVLQDQQAFKNIYAKKSDIVGRLNYQNNNLTLLSLLAPLDNFNEAFKTLLVNGADPNYEAFMGLTPLQIAINADNGTKVQSLLEHGAKANFEGANNILTKTYNLRQTKALKALSKYAKKTGVPFTFPENYFISAMINNQQSLAEAVLPLTNKEITNIPNNFGVFPLTQAALSNNIDLVDALLENGADINIKGTNNRTPVLQYLHEIYLSKIEENNDVVTENNKVVEMVKHFLEKGADAQAKDDLGEDIMFYVVRGNYMELVDVLINTYKCDINIKNDQGETPLFIVAQNYPNMVHPFLEKGANPKVADITGRTPAVAAVEMGNMDTYDFLSNAASMII